MARPISFGYRADDRAYLGQVLPSLLNKTKTQTIRPIPRLKVGEKVDLKNPKTGRWVNCDNDNCNKRIYRRPSELKYKHSFCSPKCNYSFKRGKRLKPPRLCIVCGNSVPNANEKYCRDRCYKKDIKGIPKGKEHSEKIKNGLKNRNQKGLNNPNWNGGTTSERTKIYNSKKYQNWRRKVFERDDFTCQDCGVLSDGNRIKIIAHHKKSFSKYPELRFSVDNGQTLCVGCHGEVHYAKVDQLFCN